MRPASARRSGRTTRGIEFLPSLRGALATKQSILPFMPRDGLLRFARNDVPERSRARPWGTGGPRALFRRRLGRLLRLVASGDQRLTPIEREQDQAEHDEDHTHDHPE